MSLTLERARVALRYDAETGLLHWLVSRGKARTGAVAGCPDERGYIVLSLDGKRYYAHRIAWLLMTGAWPAELVDHINGIKGDNRWSNLRDVTHEINQQNQRAASRNSRSGILGVRVFAGKHRAKITVNSSEVHLGTFDSAEAAGQAYLDAKRRMHKGCTL